MNDKKSSKKKRKSPKVEEKFARLAEPKTRREKYVPPVYKPGSVDSGVKQSALKGHNFDSSRINMLMQRKREIMEFRL